MPREILESDWKIFKELRAVALERFCQRACEEAAAIASAAGPSAHDRYLNLFEHVEATDKKVAHAFNDFRRSTAFLQILAIYALDVLTEQELQCFSPETQEYIRACSNDR